MWRVVSVQNVTLHRKTNKKSHSLICAMPKHIGDQGQHGWFLWVWYILKEQSFFSVILKFGSIKRIISGVFWWCRVNKWWLMQTWCRLWWTQVIYFLRIRNVCFFSHCLTYSMAYFLSLLAVDHLYPLSGSYKVTCMWWKLRIISE